MDSRTDRVASALSLQVALCRALGLEPTRVQSVTISADAGPELVRVGVRMLLSESQREEILAAIAEHAPGVEVRIG